MRVSVSALSQITEPTHVKEHLKQNVIRGVEARSCRSLSSPLSAAQQPELNPIERVWKLIRRYRPHNQDFRSLI